MALNFAAAPARTLVEELGAGDADEQDRRVVRPLRQMLDEVEKRRLGPLQVIEQDDQRPSAALRLEEPTDGRRSRRSGPGRPEVDRGRDSLCDQARVVPLEAPSMPASGSSP